MLAPLLLLTGLISPNANLGDELGATVTLGAACAAACPRGEFALGAGEIIGSRPDGSLMVLTARHVIEGASSLRVFVRNNAWPGIDLETFSHIGHAHKATVIAWSMDVDLALVAFEPGANDSYTVAPFAHSGNDDQPGVVVGNPNGTLWTYSPYRFLERNATSIDLDCDSCGPGDSGGGVFDAAGNLEGIVISQRVNGDDSGPQELTSRFQAISTGEVESFLAAAHQRRIIDPSEIGSFDSANVL